MGVFIHSIVESGASIAAGYRSFDCSGVRVVEVSGPRPLPGKSNLCMNEMV